MTPQPDDHTLNACMARAIGLRWAYDPQTNDHGYFDSDGNFRYTRDQWSPLQNANQMDEVEAWMVEQGYCIEYQHLSQLDCLYRITPGQMDDLRSWTARDPDKKRAFALAVWEMEQSQKEK